LRFFDPRAYSLGFLGACFLREVRFDFLRSSFVRLFVFAISYVVPEFSLIAKIPAANRRTPVVFTDRECDESFG